MKKLNVAIIGQGRSGRDIHGAFFKSEYNEKFIFGAHGKSFIAAQTAQAHKPSCSGVIKHIKKHKALTLKALCRFFIGDHF